MKAFYCHQFVLPLPDGHSFPMAKYARLHERVAEAAARLGIALEVPEAATDEDLLRVHCPDYVARMSAGGGDRLAGDGVAVNLAGGTHHAAFARGGGYCVFNDSVVAARHVQAHGLARRLLVVDLDVHQGNGTAELCANDDSITTLSMHGARNYPAVKPASDFDVALPDGCGDAEYLDRLAAVLPRAIDAARPDAVVYLAGADPWAGDRLGLLGLSKPGLAQRDRTVLEHCRRHGLPLSIAMAGGYAPDVDDIVDIHFATVSLAAARAGLPAAEPVG